MELHPEEGRLRDRLGIPVAAARVLVFAESSHWDPNWIQTSEEYYERYARHTLDAALHELQKQPRRVFSIECVFFLRMYWERNPDRRAAVRDLLNEGRLRLTGTGVTTPDTTLPGTEAILRDYLTGARWLRDNGIEQRPELAYLPDNFGNSPALPSLLGALGYRFAAISRIDGMSFIGDDYRMPGWYPRPGSSAEVLRDLATLDFTWRAPDGAEVICHWNAFTYFQGDMLAYRGIIRWMNRVLGWTDRSAWNVGSKIDSFVRRLEPLSRTPYLFCPIGCDFNNPIPDLLELLDRYNWVRYPKTGTWAVLAGQDDYLRLVVARGAPLPTIALDPNPYWMGFYSTRPQFKQRVRQLGHSLAGTEHRLTQRHEAWAGHPDAFEALQRGWDGLVVSNHHDFVTGTAPERVYRLEQSEFLRAAESDAAEAASHAPLAPRAAAVPGTQRPRWTRSGEVLEIETDWQRVQLDARVGGCITGWWPADGDGSVVTGPSNDVVAYRDSGGLWRMGHEFNGGTFREVDCASRHPASMHVEEREGALEVIVQSVVGRRPVERRLWFRADSPVVRLRAYGSAARRRTVTCRFQTRLRPIDIDMDVPGGVVRRGLLKVYDPTFWCASNFVHARDATTGEGLALVAGGPASVSVRADGIVEWVMLRNTPRELAFGFLPVPAHPASGPNDDRHGFDGAVWFTATGNWRDNRLHVAAEHLLWAEPGFHGPNEPAREAAAIQTDHVDVRVRAVKPAEDGRGIVVRLASFAPGAVTVRLAFGDRPIERALVCDALEHDLAEAGLDGGRAIIPVQGSITTARIFLAKPV